MKRAALIALLLAMLGTVALAVSPQIQQMWMDMGGAKRRAAAAGLTVWDQKPGQPADANARRAYSHLAPLGTNLYLMPSYGSQYYKTNVFRCNAGNSWTQIAGPPNTNLSYYNVSAAWTLTNLVHVWAQGLTNIYFWNGATWTEGVGMPYGLQSPMGEVIGSTLYVGGGNTNGGLPRTNWYSFDGATWSEIVGMPVAKAGSGCAVLSNCLIVAGGYQGSMDAPNTNAYIFDPAVPKWTQIAGLPKAVDIFGGCATLGSTVYVCGGYAASYVLTNLVQGYNGATWSATAYGVLGKNGIYMAAPLGASIYALVGDGTTATLTNLYYYTP